MEREGSESPRRRYSPGADMVSPCAPLPSSDDADRPASWATAARSSRSSSFRPEDAGGGRQPLRDGRGPEAPGAGLRLRHLRRRRRDPRRDGRDRDADQARARARGDGASELRRRDARGARGDPRSIRGRRDRERACPSRRPAAGRSRVSGAGRRACRARRSSPGSSPSVTTSRSAGPAFRRFIPRRPASRPTSPT